jgi:hypothetical protein
VNYLLVHGARVEGDCELYIRYRLLYKHRAFSQVGEAALPLILRKTLPLILGKTYKLYLQKRKKKHDANSIFWKTA